MTTPNLPYDELLWLEEQLPATKEGEVFNMHLHDQPSKDFGYLYYEKPSQKDTITVSLAKSKYADLATAKKRALELFKLRSLKPYQAFQTRVYYCWYCVPLEDK